MPSDTSPLGDGESRLPPDAGPAGTAAPGADAPAGGHGAGASGAADATTGVERELALLLRRARAFSWQFAREFHPELDAGAYGLLLWLDDQGSARLTEMAAFFGVGKPTVSRQIHLLESLDLITRSADPEDRRAQIIQLTASGATRLHEVRETRRERFRTLFEDWPEADVDTLAQLLGRLNGVLAHAPGPA